MIFISGNSFGVIYQCAKCGQFYCLPTKKQILAMPKRYKNEIYKYQLMVVS